MPKLFVSSSIINGVNLRTPPFHMSIPILNTQFPSKNIILASTLMSPLKSPLSPGQQLQETFQLQKELAYPNLQQHEENPLAPKGLGLLRERYQAMGQKDVEHLHEMMRSIKVKDRGYLRKFVDTNVQSPVNKREVLELNRPVTTATFSHLQIGGATIKDKRRVISSLQPLQSPQSNTRFLSQTPTTSLKHTLNNTQQSFFSPTKQLMQNNYLSATDQFRIQNSSPAMVESIQEMLNQMKMPLTQSKAFASRTLRHLELQALIKPKKIIGITSVTPKIPQILVI